MRVKTESGFGEVLWQLSNYIKSGFKNSVVIRLNHNFMYFFGRMACGILVPPPGIELSPLAVKDRLATGPPENSLD